MLACRMDPNFNQFFLVIFLKYSASLKGLCCIIFLKSGTQTYWQTDTTMNREHVSPGRGQLLISWILGNSRICPNYRSFWFSFASLFAVFTYVWSTEPLLGVGKLRANPGMPKMDNAWISMANEKAWILSMLPFDFIHENHTGYFATWPITGSASGFGKYRGLWTSKSCQPVLWRGECAGFMYPELLSAYC